ncbi:hypothetical protein ACRALDRAFT_1059993 [Sodiomyces alcalophilus JCM 7366]|uniref:uncharacterized protein n=1 Tax=Sodiomyces alcalophilus JCM 7366 TaxID=591952 RepID=UPI0039B38EBD
MAKDESKFNGDAPSPTTTSVHANPAAPNQSMRPGVNHRTSDRSQASDQTRDSNHTTTSHTQEPSLQPQQRPRHHPQRHVVGVGRLNARIPSAKALYKPHGNAARLNHRRTASPSPERYTTHDGTRGHGHRRVQSEAKLSRDSSSANLRRNKSQVDVQSRPKSADKFQLSPSHFPEHRAKTPAKSQVHFDLGTDDQDEEDEWVDASTSASPYLSRRGSMASGQSSAKPGCSSTSSSRPQTPGDARDAATGPIQGQNGSRREEVATRNLGSSPPASTVVDRETAQRREYLTTRLLQRTPTQGAPPMMTADTALVSQNRSPNPSKPRSTLTHMGFNDGLAATGSSDGAELTSHFVGASSSGANTQDGPSYRTSDASRPNSRRSDDTTRRPASSQTQQSLYNDEYDHDDDGSALAPRKARRAAPPAQESRIQQKLNLQRASSAIEPGQSGGGGMGLGNMGMGMGMGMGRLNIGTGMGMGMGPGGATPFVGVAGASYDGSASRDPRIAKQLERTGMEYLSVRRYQNPVLRSLHRIARMEEAAKTQHIPTPGRNGVANPPGAAAINGHKTTTSSAPPSRPGTAHSRQVSLARDAAALADDRLPVTPRAQSIRTLHSVGGGSSFEGEASTGLSGSSLVGGEDEDVTAVGSDDVDAILRALWDKNADTSASQD